MSTAWPLMAGLTAGWFASGLATAAACREGGKVLFPGASEIQKVHAMYLQVWQPWAGLYSAKGRFACDADAR
jgi:hypothetical protein